MEDLKEIIKMMLKQQASSCDMFETIIKLQHDIILTQQHVIEKLSANQKP